MARCLSGRRTRTYPPPPLSFPRRTVPVLQASKLHVRLDGRPVLRDLAFHLEGPACIGIVGPNGSGKTTLLRAISGNQHYRGSLSVDGVAVADWKPRHLARRLAFVRQQLPLSFDFTVEELVMLGRAPHRGWLEPFQNGDRSLAREALEQVGMTRYADASVLALSGGERQRVLLAQALVQDTDLLLLDEPTTHLDVHFQYAFMERVRRLVDDGRMLLVVFHDLQLASRFSDRLLVLHDGTLAADGPPDRVLTDGLLAEVFGMEAHVIEGSDGVHIRYQRPLPH